MKKIYFITMLFLFPMVANACVFPHPAINHTTKECGYYYTTCTDEKGDILRTIPTNNWEIVDNSTLDFTEYCKSINYSISENGVPFKEVCCTWKASIFIFVITALFIVLFSLLWSKREK